MKGTVSHEWKTNVEQATQEMLISMEMPAYQEGLRGGAASGPPGENTQGNQHFVKVFSMQIFGDI